jgi:O-antigen ligase
MKYIAYILLFFLPFHAFLSNYVRFVLRADNFWLWKELFLLVVLVLNLGYKEMSKLKNAYLNWFTFLVVAYGLFIAASSLWAPGSGIGRIFVGAKFDYLFFIALFAGMSFGNLKKDEYLMFLKSAFFGGTLALFAGLGLHYLVGPENFTLFGYRNDWSTYIVNQGLAFCQKIENQDICRFQGTFSGPNQAGFFLLLYLPLAYYFLRHYWNKIAYRVGIIFSIAAGMLALFLTFSRSSWLGFIFGLFLILVFILKKHFDYHTVIRFGVVGSFTVVLGLVAVILLQPEFVIRPMSSMEHLLKWQEGFMAFLQSPIIGQGVGTAGPASRMLAETALIPENWFLQVAVQYGLIGLGLFLGIYGWMLKKLFKSKDEIGMILFVVLASMLVPAMLLHVFEDSVMSYTLMLLIGGWFVTE